MTIQKIREALEHYAQGAPVIGFDRGEKACEALALLGAMPEMCVEMPSEREIIGASFDHTTEEGGDVNDRFRFIAGVHWLRSRLKLRSVSEVREAYAKEVSQYAETSVIATKALIAERARSEKLAQSLKEVRDAIVQNSMDTLWMPSCYSPSCTAVDWIDLDLAAYEAGRDQG